MSNSPWEQRLALLARHLTADNAQVERHQGQPLQAAATAAQVRLFALCLPVRLQPLHLCWRTCDRYYNTRHCRRQAEPLPPPA